MLALGIYIYGQVRDSECSAGAVRLRLHTLTLRIRGDRSCLLLLLLRSGNLVCLVKGGFDDLLLFGTECGGKTVVELGLLLAHCWSLLATLQISVGWRTHCVKHA